MGTEDAGILALSWQRLPEGLAPSAASPHACRAAARPACAFPHAPSRMHLPGRRACLASGAQPTASSTNHDNICKRWMNKNPTIFISLKRVEWSDFVAAMRAFRDLAARICKENKYLLENDKVSQLDREILHHVMVREAD
ncbi:MAG: hypothetical protein K6E40_07340, partial [Desulfovibrio sp.]|nr:hypothetical protein [Desulfovibrio sp.]